MEVRGRKIANYGILAKDSGLAGECMCFFDVRSLSAGPGAFLAPLDLSRAVSC